MSGKKDINDKTEHKKQKALPKLTQKILTKHPYIESIIKTEQKNPKRFICTLCSKNQPRKKGKEEFAVGGQFKWLKKHLKTATHRSFTPLDDLKPLRCSYPLSRAFISRSKVRIV